MKIYHFLIIPCILMVSCHRNRLKSNEEALVKEILSEEKQLQQKRQQEKQREKAWADSIAKLPQGFRFNPERGIVPNHPPRTIDIIDNREPREIIKTSGLFKSIDYISLEAVSDSVLRDGPPMQILMGERHIYGFSTMRGIVQFDLKGHFLGFVCQNQMNTIRYPDGRIGMDLEHNAHLKVVWKTYFADGNLCYEYLDRENKTVSYYQFDDTIDCSTQLNLPGTEGQQFPQPKGKLISQTINDYASKVMTPYPLGGGLLAVSQNRKPVRQQMPLISILSAKGDTLCTFRDCDPIRNFSHSVYTTPEDYYSYYLHHVFHFKPAYNDTLFQVVPPNKLRAKYILDFGKQGLRDANKAISPVTSLINNFILDNLLETNKYVFIIYTKNYACSNTAKNKELWYSKVIYNKITGKVIPVYTDQEPEMITPRGDRAIKIPVPTIPDMNIENDLGILPFIWPQNVTPTGKPYAVFNAKTWLQQHPDKKDQVPENRRNKRYIIMIYNE